MNPAPKRDLAGQKVIRSETQHRVNTTGDGQCLALFIQ